MIGASLEPAEFEPDFGGLVLFEQIEGDAPKDGKVLCGIFDPGPALILAKRNIQGPMHALDRPVGANRLSDAGRIVCR